MAPRTRRAAAPAALLALALAATVPARADLPPEDQCPTLSGIPGGGPAEDAAPVRIKEGMLLTYQDLLLLGKLLPAEVWRNRDHFFHEGMRMEIGPCHRRYPVAGFYEAATKRFAGQARVDERGNLEGYTAGLPFPPDEIDPNAEDAALRWAWNLERRYRGAGPSGHFRLVDMPSRIGGIQVYSGDWFQLQTGHRADRPETGYRVPDTEDSAWVAGGRFLEPSNARHLAWRQIRPLGVAGRYELPDETFVYVPTMRKVRRAATTWVDGLYTPRYRVTGDAGGGAVPIGGGGGFGPGGSISPSAGESIAITENLRRGFTGLALRPNAYVWRLLDEREVLAPINIVREGFPKEPERNFGPSGLSAGSDRWEVRYVVVIQGALKERGREYDYVTLYVDYQTQQPLYYITKQRDGARLAEVGILLHRFSGDVIEYPAWPGGEPAHVFDPVAAVFFDSADGGSGWRREAYDTTSVPPDDDDVPSLVSPSYLSRGR